MVRQWWVVMVFGVGSDLTAAGISLDQCPAAADLLVGQYCVFLLHETPHLNPTPLPCLCLLLRSPPPLLIRSHSQDTVSAIESYSPGRRQLEGRAEISALAAVLGWTIWYASSGVRRKCWVYSPRVASAFKTSEGRNENMHRCRGLIGPMVMYPIYFAPCCPAGASATAPGQGVVTRGLDRHSLPVGASLGLFIGLTCYFCTLVSALPGEHEFACGGIVFNVSPFGCSKVVRGRSTRDRIVPTSADPPEHLRPRVVFSTLVFVSAAHL